MRAICGAIWWRGGSPAHVGLSGVHQILAPFGRPDSWEGRAGPCLATLAVHEPSGDQGGGLVQGDGLVVCADAHLHRRDELQSSLGLPPSAGDSEVVLSAYKRWGPASVERLTGSFAIVVVDQQLGGVFLARDHAGGRALSVHEADGVVRFATTTLALTGFAEVGHELDLDRAAEILILANWHERRLVRGVRSLLPGHALWVDGGGVRSWRWWPRHDFPVRDAGSMQAHATALRGALEVAVRSSTQGAAKVGALVSGGLDSTSVVAVAATQSAPEVVPTYTSVPPAGWSGSTPKGWIADERFAVEALARRITNLRPRFVEVAFGPLFRHGESLWELGAVPISNPLNLIWLSACYKRAAADGVDVLLTGSSGNFAFSADGPLWLVELARRGRAVRLASEAVRFSSAFGLRLDRVLRRELLAHILPGVRRRRSPNPGVAPLAAWVSASAIRPERLAEMDLEEVLSPIARPHPGGFTRDTGMMFMNGAGQADFFAAVAARWGVELRDPTADRLLVELAVIQPEWWRRHNGEWRAICRAAMRDLLPPEIVDRATLGAQQPDWLDRMTAARAEVLDELDAIRHHPASYELIDVERLDLLVARWPDRGLMTDKRVIYDYKLALSRAIFLSRYMRWFDERARRVRSGGPAVVLAPDE